ncbi:hypothetical protein Nepgr_030591 [Nepenthes gracilis]|uniref:Uncharacterized protein n=1 Tax=Nepenthes gracilis TaxID=150966 RepID=A0AAD3TGV3_NEPGR|nr:hypothetical protein Nepgr_030591 [Nepenthes gracilis]
MANGVGLAKMQMNINLVALHRPKNNNKIKLNEQTLCLWFFLHGEEHPPKHGRRSSGRGKSKGYCLQWERLPLRGVEDGGNRVQIKGSRNMPEHIEDYLQSC